MQDGWTNAWERFERARQHGFRFQHDDEIKSFRPKLGAHDDGPFNGPFLGGLGTANFSRDLHGRFSRWHLQQGVHVHQRIGSAFLAVSWSRDGRRHARRIEIGRQPNAFAAGEREYATLFPVSYEFYRGDFPFELLLEYYSPTIPGDDVATSLPVTLFNLRLRATGSEPLDLSAAMFWPNLLGWRQFLQTSELRAGPFWPAFTNAGNFCEHASLGRPGTCAVAQRRREPVQRARDMTGETVLAVAADGELTAEISFLAAQVATGTPDGLQRYTAAYVERVFGQTGSLPGEGHSWTAHWNEPLASAVSARLTLPAGGETGASFVVAHDWPFTEFGAGRCWEKEYTRHCGAEGRSGAALAADALERNDGWLAAIDAWQERALGHFAKRGVAGAVAGCALNELSFVVGGGSAWVARQHRTSREASPTLPSESHFGLLEGFDNGYFYYNTSDLWVYAFPSLSLNWPALADGVFRDYLETIPLVVDRRRPFYRSAEIAPLLVAGKLPHDLGAAADDPWVNLNGYSFRDDPNLWKDHNPAFIVSYLLHAHLRGRNPGAEDYERLRQAAEFIIAQDDKGQGIPEHRDFGDSTWDNLDMKGLSAYAGAFCLAAWAGMARLAARLGEAADAERFENLRQTAAATMETLWNGEYYLTNSHGKYGRAVMADALFGLFYADLMGLPDLLPAQRIRSHLEAVFRYGFRNYAEGKAGPLLVSEPDKQRYEKDGGHELQVNEVLVGTAWMYVAMLRHYGLRAEADEVAAVMRDMLYGGNGLQFRSPAAWNAGGEYRAPLNMRPLAVWLLALAGPKETAG